MNINWKTRVKHPAFWVGLAGVVVSPILAYNGATLADYTTWEGVGATLVETIKNPYLVGSVIFAILGFLGVTTDPTTKGIPDSGTAMTYEKPKED